MATVEQLMVRIDATTEQLRRELQRADQSTVRFQGSVDRRVAAIQARFQRLNGVATGLQRTLGALGVTVGAIGLQRLTTSALNSADAIGKMADRSGVSVASMQQLQHAADLAGVSSSELEQALGQLARRMGEGKVQADSVEAALAGVAERIQGAGSAAERATIAQEAFGRAGQRLLPMLQSGAAGLAEAAREADRLGLVLDEKLVRGAEAANDQMSRLGRVMRTELQRGVLSGFATDSERIGEVYSDPAFREGIREFGNFVGTSIAFLVRNAQTVTQVAQALAALYVGFKVGAAVGGRRGGLVGAGVAAGALGIAQLIRESAEDLSAATEELQTAFDNFGRVGFTGGGGGGSAGGVQVFRNEVAQLVRQLKPAAAAFEDLTAKNRTLQRAFREGLIPAEVYLDLMQRLNEAYAEQVDPLAAVHREIAEERRQLGMTTKQRELHVRMLEVEARMRAAGLDLTEAQRRALEREFRALQTLGQERQAANDNLRREQEAQAAPATEFGAEALALGAEVLKSIFSEGKAA